MVTRVIHNHKLTLFKKIILGLLIIPAIALSGQIYVFLNPGYSNILIDLDPVLGWKLTPHIEFIHTGDNWYANERSAHHKINLFGFNGPEWSIDKPSQTARIALMGDSFVEALQVPREQNAASVLEKELNRLANLKQMSSRFPPVPSRKHSYPFLRYPALQIAT